MLDAPADRKPITIVERRRPARLCGSPSARATAITVDGTSPLQRLEELAGRDERRHGETERAPGRGRGTTPHAPQQPHAASPPEQPPRRSPKIRKPLEKSDARRDDRSTSRGRKRILAPSYGHDAETRGSASSTNSPLEQLNRCRSVPRPAQRTSRSLRTARCRLDP